MFSKDDSKTNIMLTADSNIQSKDMLKTVTNDTLIKFGPTFAMPGHLLFDFQNDIRIISDLAEGGGGAIKLGELLTSTAQENRKDRDRKVIIKLIKSTDEGNENSIAELRRKAIWQQEICIMW